MKRIISLLIVCLLVTLLVGCHQHGHDNKKVVRSATCTEGGEYEYTCNECGETFTEKEPALGHDWEPANCQRPKTCKRCKKQEGEKGSHVIKQNGECQYCRARYYIKNFRKEADFAKEGMCVAYYSQKLSGGYCAYINDLSCTYSGRSVTINMKGYVKDRSNDYDNQNYFEFYVMLENGLLKAPASSEFSFCKEIKKVRISNLNKGDTFNESVTFSLDDLDNLPYNTYFSDYKNAPVSYELYFYFFDDEIGYDPYLYHGKK